MLSSRPLITPSAFVARSLKADFRRKGSLSCCDVEVNHADRRSFEDYADQVGLNKNSTVYRGTKYEYTAIDALGRFYLNLRRQGGRDDLGIDLLGTWTLPPFTHPLRVLASCKSHAKTPQPSWVRELEGAFAGDPHSSENSRVVGFLVAASETTSGVRDALARSNLPLGFINITLEGGVRQMLWNQRAADMGLERVTPKIRNTEKEGDKDMGDQKATMIVLMENDKILDKMYGNSADTF